MGQELLTACILLAVGALGISIPGRWYPQSSRRYFGPVIPRALGMIFVLIGLLSGISVFVQPMAEPPERLEAPVGMQHQDSAR